MRRRFFVEEFEAGCATLRGEAAHHLGRVLRAETGQLYELSDGQCVWLARTESVGRDEVRFSLVEQLPVQVASVRIELLLAIVKFDRFEWALEKATELGVEEISPLASERSEKGLVAAAGKRAERWKRILAESAQQARRLRIPGLKDAEKPRDAFRASDARLKLLLSERAAARPLREVLEPVASVERKEDGARVAIAIGPEGGWTDAEFASAAA
jgi:16S rRNA (uracil1498-N3)-methyltransferase